MNLIKRDEDLLDVVREWRLAVHVAKTKSAERKYEMAVIETKDGEYLVTKWPCPGKYENYERITIIRDERMIAEFVSCD